MEIVFLFGDFWDYVIIGDICNAFVIDGRYCVGTYLQKLKGVLMWQILFCLVGSQGGCCIDPIQWLSIDKSVSTFN